MSIVYLSLIILSVSVLTKSSTKSVSITKLTSEESQANFQELKQSPLVEIEETNNDFQKARKSIETLNQTLKQATNDITMLKARTTALQTQSSSKKEITKVTKKISTLRGQYYLLKANISRLSTEVSQLQRSLASATPSSGSSNTIIKKMEENYERQNKTLVALEQRIKAIENKSSAYEFVFKMFADENLDIVKQLSMLKGNSGGNTSMGIINRLNTLANKTALNEVERKKNTEKFAMALGKAYLLSLMNRRALTEVQSKVKVMTTLLKMP